MRGFFLIRWLIVFAALGLMPAHAASLHRMIVHPNSSLTILSIAEAPDGLLWLATTGGVYRFDGFHYDKVAGYPFSSARFIGFTRDGSLWAGDFQGLVRYRGGQFEIVLRDEVLSFAAFPSEIYVYVPKRFLRITVDGAIHPLSFLPRRDLNIDASGRLWLICGSLMSVCRVDPRHPDHVDALGPADYQEALGSSDGSIWVADDVQAVWLKGGRIARKLERAVSTANIRPGPLLAGHDGQIWFLGEAIFGLTTLEEFRDRVDNERYPPLAGFEDGRRHLWVSALGRGLLEWIRDQQWQSWFPEDFAMEPAIKMARDRRGALVLATRKNLYRLNGERWSPLMKEQRRVEYVLPLDDGTYLASIRDFGLARISREGTIVERLKDPLPATEAYRRIARDGRGRLWVASKRALFRIDGHPGSLRLREEPLPEMRPREMSEPVDFEVDSRGRLWVGYANGIAFLDEQDVWHQVPTDQPVTLVRSFALAGNDDEIWVAYRRPGSFSRLLRSGNIWKVEMLAHPPVDTHFVKRDSRGWIWRGTPSGVYVSDGIHIGPDDWIHLDMDRGLALNETDNYGFFEDSDHSVWIAGAEGVTHFKPESWWFGAAGNSPPQITRVEADGQELAFQAPGLLPAGIKLLRIEVGGMDASPFREAPLRYRLLPVSKDWRLSRDGTLEFRDLARTAYTLEVGYVGGGATGSWKFDVGPATPRVSWLWLLLLPAGLALFVLRIVRDDPVWFAKLRFRMEKSLFLLRRRRQRGRTDTISENHSGQTLAGRYYLRRIVSRGGFSVVYEGLDLIDGNARVAVKVMNHATGDKGWVRDRFAHEVAALRSIDHAGVVPVLESWVSPAGEPCLAMPFLDGPTLRAAISGLPFGSARAAQIIRSMAAALAEVHRHGIVHRDLKPENVVLLNPESNLEQPVILDFGTAGLRTASDELAATTLMAGSFHYMSPERLTGRYSPASDVFSFAVIILEVLTGKTLAGLKASFYDVEFCDELAMSLAPRIGSNGSRKAAQCLALAFNPDPRRRPADVQVWAGEIAALVDSVTGSD